MVLCMNCGSDPCRNYDGCPVYEAPEIHPDVRVIPPGDFEVHDRAVDDEESVSRWSRIRSNKTFKPAAYAAGAVALVGLGGLLFGGCGNSNTQRYDPMDKADLYKPVDGGKAGDFTKIKVGGLDEFFDPVQAQPDELWAGRHVIGVTTDGKNYISDDVIYGLKKRP